MPDKIAITLDVNGKSYDVNVEPRRSLADVLREDCGLTGTHLGCEHGVCGACTVLVDGRPVRACLMFGVQAEGKAIRIGGHADASGPEDYNQRLSQARAASVRDYLENRHGIAPSRLQVVGYGESAPLPGTDPFAGVNRRVEFEPLN